MMHIESDAEDTVTQSKVYSTEMPPMTVVGLYFAYKRDAVTQSTPW